MQLNEFHTEQTPQIWTVEGISYLERDMTYKYLGVKQHFRHDDLKASKDQIEGKFTRIVSKVVL